VPLRDLTTIQSPLQSYRSCTESFLTAEAITALASFGSPQ
jgi:hypothetical protein